MRFTEVFTGLLLLSLISAFFLPAELTKSARNIQAVFYPVARPAGAVGAAFAKRFADADVPDNRKLTDIRMENDQLRQMVSQLTAELLELQQLNADRQMVGDLRQYCTPVRVVGTDSGKRESLALLGGTGQGIRSGQPVLALKGLVGKVHSAGVGGSQVMLVTDREFRAIGEFRRFERNAQSGEARYVATGATPPVVKGAGEDGLMTITNVPLKETAAGKNDMPDIEPVKVGDVVVLNDDEWPYARGRWLGHVESIEPNRSAPLFAQITVRPALNLAALREVQVMTRTPDDAAATAGSVLTPQQ